MRVEPSKLSARGPVFITDHGRPAHVLLTIEVYQKLDGCHASIIDQLVWRLRLCQYATALDLTADGLDSDCFNLKQEVWTDQLGHVDRGGSRAMFAEVSLANFAHDLNV